MSSATRPRKPARKRAPRKLTAEQKKALYAPSKANAGAGWEPKWGGQPADPVAYEEGRAS